MQVKKETQRIDIEISLAYMFKKGTSLIYVIICVVGKGGKGNKNARKCINKYWKNTSECGY
jgi:hypothetical protein